MKRIVSSLTIILLLLSLLVFAIIPQPAKAASGAIYIKSDGSISSPVPANITTNDKVTFSFTGNNYLPIVVQRGNIVINGAGHALKSIGNRTGINCSYVNNVTIKNMNIEDFTYGIELISTSNDKVSENKITNNQIGIYLEKSPGNIVSENNVTACSKIGVELNSSSGYNTVARNNIANNPLGIFIKNSSNNALSSNNITGSSYYDIHLQYSSNHNTISANRITNSSRGICLSSSLGCTVFQNTIANSSYGVYFNSSSGDIISENWITQDGYGFFAYSTTTNNSIMGNSITGNNNAAMELWYSSNYTVSENYIANNWDGAAFYDFSDSNISSNVIINNHYDGIDLGHFFNGSIQGNNIVNNDYGLSIAASSGNTAFRNNMTGNYYGILVGGDNNTVMENIVTNNTYGIYDSYCSNNAIYHNDFIGNVQQVFDESSTNSWDAGYPSGGNYWSDYTGVDQKNGPYQNLTGSDGIGDTPYIIDANNKDRYPLMTPWPQMRSTGCVVGITGYKLVFKETMDNTISQPATVNYYWSISAYKWNGSQWIATVIGSPTTPVNGYSLPAQTIVTLPYCVYLLNSSALKWNDWLVIIFTFHWTYNGASSSTDYFAALNVHPADIAGIAQVAFPYLGADGVVGAKDLHVVGIEWGLSSVGADPTSNLARADINGDGVVGAKDLHILGTEWSQTWTNTPPP